MVCPVCFWEDDFVCVTYEEILLDKKSDLNRELTLREARNNFKKFGAWLNEFREVVISKEERYSLKYEPRNI